MSEQVDKLHDFISHDWHTGRWVKFFALCLVYNGDAAVIVSILVGIAGTVLMAFLPKWLTSRLVLGNTEQRNKIGDMDIRRPVRFLDACVLCPATFILVFFFWQHMRRLIFRRARIAFVDKLCISQTDEELKKEGIRSLAGFIRRSDRLVVLWSPRYFARVWCVYELASWLHFHSDLKASMLFVPVNLSAEVCILTAVVFLYCVVLRVCVALGWQPYWKLCHLMVMISTQLPTVTSLRFQFQSLRQLPRQLERFSMEAAECFCCTHNHVHPETGVGLPCDRMLVYGTLHKWHWPLPPVGTSACSPASRLHAFDKYVQTDFKKEVLRGTGRVRISYRHALFTSTPSVWFAVERIGSIPDPALGALLREVSMDACFTLCSIPCLWQLTVVAVQVSNEIRGDVGSAALNVALTIGIVGFQCTFLLVGFLPLLYTVTIESVIPQICLMLFHGLLTLGLYLPGLRARIRRGPAAACCGWPF